MELPGHRGGGLPGPVGGGGGGGGGGDDDATFDLRRRCPPRWSAGESTDWWPLSTLRDSCVGGWVATSSVNV